MAGRITRRLVPLLSGFFWIAVSAVIMAVWPEPDGFLYYIRFAVTLALVTFGLACLWDAFFSSSEKLDRLMSDQSENSN